MYRRNWLKEMDQISEGCGSSSSSGSGCCTSTANNGSRVEENENTRIIMITRRSERLRIRKDSGRCCRLRKSSPYYKDLSRILAIFLVILSVGSSMAVMAYHNDLSAIASSSGSSDHGGGVSANTVSSTSSSSNRLGCVWSRTGGAGTGTSLTNRNSNSATSSSLNNGNNNGQSNGMYAPGNNPFQERQQHQTFSSSSSLSPSSAVSPYYTSNNGGGGGSSSSVVAASSSTSLSDGGGSGGSGGGRGVLTLSCNVRTLNADFSNYTSASSFTREQVEEARVARVKCSDKLFFQSFLYPNQTLFQLRNLRELEVDSCKIRKVPKAVFSSWRFLKKLEIHTNNFQWAASVGLELEVGAFQGLEAVEVLDLSHSNIWTLFPEPNVLCPMRNLVKLNVSWNRLTDIDEFGLEKGGSREDGGNTDGENYCALNIQKVDLSSNFLRRIGKAGFSRLHRLVELRLQHNLIEELEDKALAGLNQLKHLDMSSNRLVALPPNIFSKSAGGPGNLQEVILSNNSISALSPKVFDGLDQLLLLDLSRNFLQSLSSEKVFAGLIRLVVLKLSFNQLTSISAALFTDLISLQALYLDNNNIEVIEPEAFANLRNLNTIDLQHNRLSSIDSRHFSNLFVLKQLFLDHNQLREIHDESLKNCTSLEDLGLSNNLLANQVPVAIRGLGQLKTLDIGENRITTLTNESFRGLSQIYGLRLVENRISELPPGFCESLKNLRVLNCAQNKISRVSSAAFLSCPQVRALRLDSNLLEEIPLTLSDQLPSLLWLNVSDNHRLKWVDYRLLPPSLEWLDVSHNQLTSLTKPLQVALPQVRGNSRRNNKSSLPVAFNLRVLDASYNKLSSLDHTNIPPLLDTLRLNHNEITSIAPNTFTVASQLRRVELIGNQIETLPLASIRFQPIAKERRLPEIYLGDNPFLCECSMEWLTRVTQLEVLRQYPRIVDLNSIVCRPTFHRGSPNSIDRNSTGASLSSSSSLANQNVIPLLEARPNDFLCQYESHCFATCSCCQFACDCFMECPDNCTCFHDLSWSSNIVSCSNLQYNQVPPKMPMDATEIYLDGNNFGNELSSHIFIGKKNLRALFLNNSQIESLRNKTFNGLKSLEILHLQNNYLQQVQGYEFADVTGLKELYLQNNLIRYVSPNSFERMTFLQVLRLDGNLLVDYNVWELTKTNGYLHSVMLSGNPWSCNCDFVQPFRQWVSSLKNTVVVDFTLAKCQPTELVEGELEGINNSNSTATATTTTTTTSAAILNGAGSPIPTTHLTLLISSLCSPNPGSNDNLSFMNNHISSVGGASDPTMNNNFSPYQHAHLENSARNYDKEFPQNENIIATTAAAAGERGGRRSSKGSSTDEDDNLTENSTFLICLATFIAILLVASFVLIVGLVTRKRRGMTASTSSSWWHYCCFSKCGFNGGSALALANKFLSAQNASSTPNEGESSDGSASYYYSDSGKLFDAYFIYSQQDEEFVEKLSGELEQGGQNQHYFPPTNCNRLKLLFQKDLCLAPPWNSEMIKSACDASKRIVLIISNNFLNSEWTNAHFRGSLHTAMQQNWGKLIVIKLHDSNINDNYWKNIVSGCEQRNGNNNMQSNNTSSFPFPANLDWADSNFWPKFRLLLPQAQRGSNRNDLIPITPNTNNFSTISSTTLQQLPYSTHLNMNHHHHHQMAILNPATAPFLPYQVAQNQQNPQNFIALMNLNGQQGFPLSHLTTPQHFGYSNIDSLQPPIGSQNNVRTSLRHNDHPHPQHPPPQPPPPHRHHNHTMINRDLPQHIASLSQLSSHEANYSSSAVSSGNDEFDHVYSTLDSPMSDLAPQFEAGQVNRHQIQHSHSNSSGLGSSSGSEVDTTSGGCHPVPPMYFV